MKEILDFDPNAYGSTFAGLLPKERLNTIGPGSPNTANRSALDNLTVETAFSHLSVADTEMANACIAAVWLYHDFLEESHLISQSIDTPTGSYWHGIMHRREPDFPNSKHWFRRVGEHPIFEPLRLGAAQIVSNSDSQESVSFLVKQPDWDAFAFVDLCEASLKGSSEAETVCRLIQKCEWEILFDYCHQQATGG